MLEFDGPQHSRVNSLQGVLEQLLVNSDAKLESFK
jgi:hypothetical protein